MALEFVGGALLGAAVAELLKEVIDVKEKVTNFQPILSRLESTLRSIIPRNREISSLNRKLNLSDEEMKELIALLQNGQELVHKCTKVSAINLVKKVQYSKQLGHLDDSILRYFQTILPLDHFRDNKEILFMVKEMHTQLVGSTDEGESSKPKEKEDPEIQSCQESKKEEAVSSNPKNERGKELDKWNRKEDSGIQSYQELKNEEAVQLKLKNEKEKKSYKWYRRETGNQLFFLEGSSYNVDLNDILNSKFSGKGTYGNTYRCHTECEDIFVKSIEVKVGERKFKQQMKKLGKAGMHPNIEPPLGYYFSKSDKFLLQKYVPEGSLYGLLHENRGNRRTPRKWEDKVKIFLGVARGISHLDSVNLIHGNINSSNVLVTSDFDACIFDYGLASILNMKLKLLPVTPFSKLGYHAPEFTETWKATKKSDVYSFGVVLLEILTGKDPALVDVNSLSSALFFGNWTCMVYDKKLLRYRSSQSEMNEMRRIADSCMSFPVFRPTMHDIVRKIEKMEAAYS